MATRYDTVTVAQLIQRLQTFDQTLPVAYCRYSEFCVLSLEDITVETAGLVRQDGWVARSRPDRPDQQYLMFPGN